MSESVIERIRAFVARDKYTYAWSLDADYERSLARMSLSEMAFELQRTQVRHETANITIVEHMLAARLARIQSRASWWSGWVGFSGAMLAAALTFYLGQLSAKNALPVECAPSLKPEEQSIQEPAVVSTLKKNSPESVTVQPHEHGRNNKPSTAPAKPLKQ